MAKTGVYDFDKTAANNTDVAGTALTVGAMPPSNVGPAFRAIMAILKKWQEDTGGALTTTGSANAYLLNVNSDPYASSATYADGDTFTFIASFTNTGAATLSVESEGAKAIRKKNDLALIAGDILSGSMYTVHYDASANGAAGAWILEDGNLGTAMEYVAGTWTPVLTFQTPGDLSLTYTTQVGLYEKWGNAANGYTIRASFNVLTATFTHATASGVARITGLPVASSNVTSGVAVGEMVWSGITHPLNDEQINPIISPNFAIINFESSQFASRTFMTASHLTTGSTISLTGTITYRSST